MKIIKLNATESTNSFLKDLAQDTALEDYTLVVTDEQNSGRGQMDTSWHSESHKNLTFSLFTRLGNLNTNHKPYLNFAVSLAVIDVLAHYKVPKLSIKWPNDIMSATKKICGILIETTFIGSQIKNTVIGIGLNVNQTDFPKSLPNASSLKLLLAQDFSLESLLEELGVQIQKRIKEVEQHSFEKIHQQYHEHLYELNVPRAFKKLTDHTVFMGMITGVASNGKLCVQLEDDSTQEFEIKEISFAKA